MTHHRASLRRPLTRTALLTAGLALATTLQAGNGELDATFRAFTRCDGTFFSSLQTHAAAWKKHTTLQSARSVSWIPVSNRAYTEENTVPLRNAPQVGGVKLLSYFDKSVDLDLLGNYLFWGFVVEGSPAHVAEQLRPLISQGEHLLPVKALYARGEVRKDGRWERVATLPGEAPGRTRLERVLLVEPDEGSHGEKTRVTCTLQGAVDGAVLARLRPDIPTTDYPQRSVQ